MKTILCVFICALAYTRALHVCILHSPRPNNVSYIDSALTELHRQGATVRVINTTDFPRLSTADSAIPVSVQEAGHDVVSALEQCAQAHAASNPWIFMMEDDMVPCDGALAKVDAALRSDSAAAIFFSKFSRAFALQTSYLHQYTESVLAHIDSKPYDIVLRTGVWTTAPLVTYPVNLFHHIGQVSTIEERNDPLFVRTFQALRSDRCGEDMA